MQVIETDTTLVADANVKLINNNYVLQKALKDIYDKLNNTPLREFEEVLESAEYPESVARISLKALGKEE